MGEKVQPWYQHVLDLDGNSRNEVITACGRPRNECPRWEIDILCAETPISQLRSEVMRTKSVKKALRDVDSQFRRLGFFLALGAFSLPIPMMGNRRRGNRQIYSDVG